MPLILCVDTATETCSVVLASDGIVTSARESFDEKAHSKQLAIFIREVLSMERIDPGQLDGIAVSKGPGSYTGLRIGVSTAKGIAYGSNIPLMGIGTLEALASGAASDESIKNILLGSGRICPMIDARRMEVYTALFDPAGNMLNEVKAEIIDENSFGHELDEGKVVFLGNGAFKCKEKIRHPNAVFVEDYYTSAKNMVGLAEQAMQQKRFEDVAYFEPFYLKDFVATIPRNKVLPKPPPQNQAKG